MEYDNAGSMEEAVELARGLESELDAEEPEVKVTIVKETDETTEEEEVDAQQMIAGWENVLRGQVASAHYKDCLLYTSKRAVAACPLAFGEGNIKTRVKSALHYRKPAFWVAAAAVLAVVIVAVCFLTNPRSERGSLVWAQKLNAADVASIELYVPEEGDVYKRQGKEQLIAAILNHLND